MVSKCMHEQFMEQARSLTRQLATLPCWRLSIPRDWSVGG